MDSVERGVCGPRDQSVKYIFFTPVLETKESGLRRVTPPKTLWGRGQSQAPPAPRWTPGAPFPPVRTCSGGGALRQGRERGWPFLGTVPPRTPYDGRFTPTSPLGLLLNPEQPTSTFSVAQRDNARKLF